MKVVDHEPQSWFLYKEGESLLFDSSCNHGAFGYSVIIELAPEEEAEYAGSGHGYLNRLAQAVQDSGPGRGYQLRNISEYADESLRAVNEWWAAQKGGFTS